MNGISIEGLFRASRDIGITDLLYGQEAWLLLVLFAIITQLGDVWFLFLVSGVLYVVGDELPRWGINRRRGLFILALILTYVALIGVLKTVFGLPRPPGASTPPELRWLPSVVAGLFTSITTVEGPGFPSGHALGTTMIWGGLSLILDRGTYCLRVGVAGSVVVLVSLSRLILGVHYLVDIVVGIVIGIGVLGGLYWLSNHGTTPRRVLLIAVAIGVIGLIQQISFDSVTAVGSALGAWSVWRGVADMTPAYPTNKWEVVASFSIVGITSGLYGIVYILELGHLVTFLGSAITVGDRCGSTTSRRTISVTSTHCILLVYR